MIFSAESTDVGRDTGTPVSKDYTRLTSHFSGKVNWVRIDVGKDDQGQSVTPEQRLAVAVARQ